MAWGEMRVKEVHVTVALGGMWFGSVWGGPTEYSPRVQLALVHGAKVNEADTIVELTRE